ncbi:MAG: hypothetical protein M1298_00580 [Chloroflexi bacterium]|nr:hypothetical protein [Chloroflexota bacterium]
MQPQQHPVDRRQKIDRELIRVRQHQRRQEHLRLLQTQARLQQRAEHAPMPPEPTSKRPTSLRLPSLPFPLLTLLLAIFGIAGLIGTVLTVLLLNPASPYNQTLFVVALGLLVWGGSGLAISAVHRAVPARLHAHYAYVAFRQGLEIAGFVCLNLAARLLDLWTPVVAAVVLLIFTLFEVIVQISEHRT